MRHQLKLRICTAGSLGTLQMAVGNAFLAAEPSGTETNVLSEPVWSALERRLSSGFHSHNHRFSQVNRENTNQSWLWKERLPVRMLESSQLAECTKCLVRKFSQCFKNHFVGRL